MAELDKREGEGTLPLTWIWSWGAGTHGQLASGEFNDHLEPLQVTSCFMESGASIDHSSFTKILDMAGGGAHAVAVLGSEGHGQVVTWGNGQSGALGHGDERDISIPKLVKYFQGIKIRSVAAGWSHTAFVSYSGELYTCGNGSFGQLGHGDFKACLIPCKVETLPRKTISMVACGMRHTLVLATGTSREQEVYGFGSCKRGQLGIGTLDLVKTSQPNFNMTGKVLVPQRVYGLPEQSIVLLAANGDHSAALGENGSLYLWGRGFDGKSDDFVPVQVESPLRFTKVALGWNHGIALADGQLWAWGSNDRGQLGVLKGSASEPTLVSLNNDFSKCLESVTATVPPVGNAKIMMTRKEGEQIAENANSCIQHSDEVLVPQSSATLDSSSRLDVRSLPVVHNNDQVSGGSGLGAESCSSGYAGPEMIRICELEGDIVRCLSTGAEHSVVVLEDGKIMVWGWGEHGQLGLGMVQDQFYPEVVAIPSVPLVRKLRWKTFCGSGFSIAVAEQCVQVTTG